MRIEALVMLLRSLAASVRFICAFGFVLCLHSKLTRNILGFRFNNFIIQRFPFTRISRPVCFSFLSYLFQTQQLPVEDVRHTSCRRFVVLKRRQAYHLLLQELFYCRWWWWWWSVDLPFRII
ncbi:Ribonuclease [Trichinella spiralis]|uniref:Ribonuclease n=1 Tax=Trichinella spiralis TaxID=6334 RepID=A0ABR3K6S4_TRISP